MIFELENRLNDKADHLHTQQRLLKAQCSEVERTIEEPFDQVWVPELRALLSSRRALLSRVEEKLAAFAAAVPVAEAALAATREAKAALEAASAERAKGTRDRKVALARAADVEVAQQVSIACFHAEKYAVDALLALLPYNSSVPQIPGRDLAQSLRVLAFNQAFHPDRPAPAEAVQLRWLAIDEDELQGFAFWAAHVHAQVVLDEKRSRPKAGGQEYVDHRRIEVVLQPDAYRDAVRNFRANREMRIRAQATVAARALENARAQLASLEGGAQ